jgi:bzd-type benzoyl-CoA reductase N subunit
MEPLRRFNDVCGDPASYARSWKAKTGGKVIGTLCSYAPDELILAGGALPFRIAGGSGNISKADAHLQTYACSLIRGALEDALDGRLDFLHGAVFPHTCDGMQRLSDIWRINTGVGFHLDLVLPVKLNTPSAKTYMTAVLRRARIHLESLLGRAITDDDLKKAIDTVNGIRSLMRRLYDIRRDRPGAIAGSAVHTVLRAAAVMDRTDFLDLLSRVVNALERPIESRGGSGKRIFLSGGVCNLGDIYPIIESAGGIVVGDDLCTGYRSWAGLVDLGGDPLAAIADRYVRRAVCPAKHAGITRRGEDMVRLARETRAEGVIFLLFKFCDPHAFDYPYLKSILDAEGIPSLLLEVEEPASQGQFATRFEAFIEML